VKRIAAATQVGGRPLLDEPIWRGKLARLEIRLRGAQMANYRTLAGAQLGKAPGPESSILKLVGSELQQQIAELGMELLALDGLSWFNPPGTVDPLAEWIPSIFNYNRATTIYGGSSEIQKNVLAKYVLGLPTA
jgi:hypothetical protein